MPLSQARTTKKAPPRAKGTSKSKSGSRKGKDTKKATKSRKRAATESNSEDDESRSEDEPSGKTPRRKRPRVTERSSESDEVEEVDDVNPVPTPEEISDDELNSGNENGVNKFKKKI
jgi:hypothetical protein